MKMIQKNLLTMDSVTKRFGDALILDDCTLSLSTGDVIGLVGRNGVGKTTLIRTLLGLVHPDLGKVRLLGEEPFYNGYKVHHKIGVVLEHHGFYGNLTLEQNMAFFAAARGISPEKTADYYNNYWNGTDIYQTGKKIKFFSRGQKMMCAICRAFLGEPKILVLDEPVVALDILGYDRFCKLVVEAKNRGAAVLISSHQLNAIEDLCTNIALLKNKHISIIDNNGSAVKDITYLVQCSESTMCQSIISVAGGDNVFYKKPYWHFTICKENMLDVALINTALINNGISVREFRPVTDSIKKYILNQV